MINKIITLGVYGFAEAGFFAALQRASVDTFCDIRARRGLRGATYAFANAKRLERRLNDLGIRYVHRKELAPSEEVRLLQQQADESAGTKKRHRERLNPEFVAAYTKQCLSDFDPRGFLESIGESAAVVALFCVERAPQACHRSLLAERLAEDLRVEMMHLVP